MRLKAKLYMIPDWECRAPQGTLKWDSETGVLGGTLADVVGHWAREAVNDGGIAAGPYYDPWYPITDPLHDPTQLAAILLAMGVIFEHPDLAKLAPYCPDFPPPPPFDPKVVY